MLPLLKINPNLRREASAPSAQFLGYFSRKGAKDAEDAKGRKKGFYMLYMRINYTLRSLTKPFSSLLLLFLCELCDLCAFARNITGGTAPKALTLRVLNFELLFTRNSCILFS
jgi:hypothetical protein